MLDILIGVLILALLVLLAIRIWGKAENENEDKFFNDRIDAVRTEREVAAYAQRRTGMKDIEYNKQGIRINKPTEGE